LPRKDRDSYNKYMREYMAEQRRIKAAMEKELKRLGVNLNKVLFGSKPNAKPKKKLKKKKTRKTRRKK